MPGAMTPTTATSTAGCPRRSASAPPSLAATRRAMSARRIEEIMTGCAAPRGSKGCPRPRRVSRESREGGSGLQQLEQLAPELLARPRVGGDPDGAFQHLGRLRAEALLEVERRERAQRREEPGPQLDGALEGAHGAEGVAAGAQRLAEAVVRLGRERVGADGL